MIKERVKNYLRGIAEKLINFKLTFYEFEDTAIFFKSEYININLFELYNLDMDDLKDRGHKESYLEFFALLHEIAHYKQRQRFIRADHFLDLYHQEHDRYEAIADRYARRFSPQFISEYREHLRHD